MSSSQAMRYWYSPLGDTSRDFVALGNLIAHRCILLAWLLCALGHTFILEQPSSAHFGDLPRWKHFVQQIAVVAGLVCIDVLCFIVSAKAAAFCLRCRFLA